jgi:hypothetical protein
MGPGPRAEKKEAQKCAEAVAAILIYNYPGFA